MYNMLAHPCWGTFCDSRISPLTVYSYKSPARWCVCAPPSPIVWFKFNFSWRCVFPGFHILHLKAEEDLLAVPSGYLNPTCYPVFLLIPDPIWFSFGNHQVASNPKHMLINSVLHHCGYRSNKCFRQLCWVKLICYQIQPPATHLIL